MNITEQILTQVEQYVTSLDWAYIWTFIIIGYGINHYKVTHTLQRTTKVKARTRYRTALIGLLYGIALYFIRGYDLSKVEVLFQSFVFALVFHKLMIQGLMAFIAKKVLPQKVGRHFIGTNRDNHAKQ